MRQPLPNVCQYLSLFLRILAREEIDQARNAALFTSGLLPWLGYTSCKDFLETPTSVRWLTNDQDQPTTASGKSDLSRKGM